MKFDGPFLKEHATGGPHELKDEEQLREEMAQYYTLIAATDKACGQIIDVFKEKGMWDNTIVLFFTDHGDMMGGHRLRRKGTMPYEELYNIPALESTTREVLRFLDAFGVDHEMIQSTRSVLNKSDMVKFAKYEPTLDNAWHCYGDAMDFVNRAKLIDASRIARKKAEYESQWVQKEESITQEHEESVIKEEA